MIHVQYIDMELFYDVWFYFFSPEIGFLLCGIPVPETWKPTQFMQDLYLTTTTMIEH